LRLLHVTPTLRTPGVQEFVLSAEELRQRLERLDMRLAVLGDHELVARTVLPEARLVRDSLVTAA
jgi:hypothetical protein